MAITKTTSNPKNPPNEAMQQSAQQATCAQFLIDLLPYLSQQQGNTIIIKYGGQAMKQVPLAAAFARDLVLLKQAGIHPIVVHEGSENLVEAFQRLCGHIKESWVEGVRAPDNTAVQMIEMMLSGLLNKSIVAAINSVGGLAVGLSGKDGNLIEARRLRCTKTHPRGNVEQIVNLGYIGVPTAINPEILVALEETDFIPVIAPVGIGEQGETYIINANTVAEAIAATVGASSMVLLHDGPGVVDPRHPRRGVISELSLSDARVMVSYFTRNDEEVVSHLESCMEAVTNHVEMAHMIDGRVPHALLLQLLSPDPKVGTTIHQIPRP